jgi:hypothetical protein
MGYARLFRCLFLALFTAIAASAQSGLADWNNVRNIAPGTDIWVKGTHGNVSGAFQSADDQAIYLLQWRRRPFVGGRYSQRCLVPRDQVRQVRFAKRALSALAGGAIGVAAGVAAAAGLNAQYKNHESDSIVTFVFGFFGGLLGEGVGEHTAFLHGAKIYAK